MKTLRVMTAFLLLVMFAFSFCGFDRKRELRVNFIKDGEVFAVILTEDANSRNFFERIFNTKRSKLLAKIARKNDISQVAALNLMFPQLCQQIKTLSAKYDRAPKDATVKFSPSSSSKFSIAPAQTGTKLDVERLYENLKAQIDQENADIKLKVDIVYPKVTENQIAARTVLRGAFRTYYGWSVDTRKANIKLALAAINGTVVSSGERFSFNQTVGRRTAERGYQEAPIIKDGKYIAGVGGGVCHVSTAMYNCALRADMRIVSVSRHTLPVRYVPYSFDAMVSSGTDFVFENSSDFPVYIYAAAEDDYINIAIYGAALPYQIKTESVVLKELPFAEEILDDAELEEGRESILSAGVNGIESKGYLLYMQNGRVIKKQLIRYDVYAPQKRVIARGTKPVDNPPEGEMPQNTDNSAAA